MTIGTRGSFLTASALTLALTATPAAQMSKAGQAGRGQSPASMGVHGFSVVLVVGTSQGAAANESVPEAARKALTDMRDFLPYKRYQLLDAAWILCCAPDASQVSGRVRGPDGRDYVYALDPGRVADSKLAMRFVMWESKDPFTSVNLDKLSDSARLEHTRQMYEAVRERDEAEILVRSVKQKFEVGMVAGPEMESANIRLRRAEQRVQELERLATSAQARASAAQGGGGARGTGGRPVSSRREIMDSSFSISLGETVVIGTSRLNGDQALIALLTAASKPGSNR